VKCRFGPGGRIGVQDAQRTPKNFATQILHLTRLNAFQELYKLACTSLESGDSSCKPVPVVLLIGVGLMTPTSLHLRHFAISAEKGYR
jgi:hypothetical protein